MKSEFNHDFLLFAIQVEFYISQTKADNHAVREAACECIAELGIKVKLYIYLCSTAQSHGLTDAYNTGISRRRPSVRQRSPCSYDRLFS